MADISALTRVKDGRLCAGCGACAAVAAMGSVEMRRTEDGFLRPFEIRSLTDEDNQAIEAVCPGLTLEAQTGSGRDDVLWGSMVGVRTGFATDAALRRQASSGGALSAILAHLLETKAVDAVLQNGAADDLPYANKTVESRDAAGVFEAAGSRYAPSAPLARVAELLDGETRYAFVGKPCDVAALRAMAQRDARVDRVFPYKLSFFCAGVPSHAGAREVIRQLGIEESEVTSFRYRGDGWPGFAKATLRDGGWAKMSYHSSWGKVLSKHLQFRCKICPDGVGGAADVVCADAWKCDEDGYPLFEEADGISLILSRNEKGEALVKAAEAAGAIETAPLDPAEIGPMQPGQKKKKQLALSRLAALAVLFRTRPKFEGFQLREAAKLAGVKANLRSFLGTCRRVLLRGPS